MKYIKEVLKIKRFYKINQYIRAETVRVIDEKGEQVGVMPLNEALFKARQKGLDLIELAENAKPPVCKIIDFKKFRYQEDKKQKAGKKGKARQDTKEIRFTPFIAQNDYNIRIKKAREFLAEGHKIRLSVKFIGRQLTRKQFGYDLLIKAQQELNKYSKPEDKPKWQGKILNTVLCPLKNIKITNENKNAKN